MRQPWINKVFYSILFYHGASQFLGKVNLLY